MGVEDFLSRILADTITRDTALKIAEAKFGESHKPVSVEDTRNEGWFAGAVVCTCETDQCEYMKSGYIFDTSESALEYAEEMYQGILESIADQMVEMLKKDIQSATGPS